MEIRILAPSGVIGAGFRETSLERAIERKPHFIACDGGSTDSGPSYLGSGKPKLSREAVLRDLRLLLIARDRLKIPLIIGSCGTAGRHEGVAWMEDMAREIAAEENLSFKLATIRSDQSSDYLKARLASGHIAPLEPAPLFNDDIIDNSHIVGMMGTEPIIAAIEGGADVILAGRASDSALYAALPIHMGAHPGMAWHAAKTIECGCSCCETPASDCIFATIRDDHFEIEPLDPGLRVTPVSVAAHTLYENANPFLLTEPSGVVDTSEARYEPASDRAVIVRGSQFLPAERYSIKLEGAMQIGYQTIAVGGIRDPQIIAALPALLPAAATAFRERALALFPGDLTSDNFEIRYRLYGIDAVMGELEPARSPTPPAEIGILISVTAPTQEIATKIMTFVAHKSAHLPVPGYAGLISTIAYPVSPPEIERGAIYRFSVNHVIYPNDPLEMFPITFSEI